MGSRTNCKMVSKIAFYCLIVVCVLDSVLWGRFGLILPHALSPVAVSMEYLKLNAPEVRIPQEPKRKRTDTDKSTKVILSCYYRTGSTFLGEFIENYPNTFYLFEPVRGIYKGLAYNPDILVQQHYRLGESEQIVLAELLEDLLNCKFEYLPPEFFKEIQYFLAVHRITRLHSYKACMDNLKQAKCLDSRCADLWRSMCLIDNERHSCKSMGELLNNINSSTSGQKTADNCTSFCPSELRLCIDMMTQSCRTADLRAFKSIRLGMNTIGNILSRNHNIKIIHNMRDPRGTLRSQGFSAINTRTRHQAQTLCSRQLDDVIQADNLRKTYPDNLLFIKYEELSQYPMENLKTIYRFLNLTVPFSLKNHIYKITHNKKTKTSFMDTKKNSTYTAYAWRQNLPKPVQEMIMSVPACRRLVATVYGSIAVN